MPSKYLAQRLSAELDQPNLSPNQAEEIKARFHTLETLENDRFVTMAAKDAEALGDRIQDAEERLRPALDSWGGGVKEADDRRSVSELVAIREEIQKALAYLEWDGEKNFGLLKSFEGNLQIAADIEADSGPYRDAFYQKFPSLAEGRMNISNKELTRYSQTHHPLT